MIMVRNFNWGEYYPGGRRSILTCSECVQSKEKEIYSTNDVVDSYTGVNGDDRDISYSDNKDGNHLYSNGRDLSELYNSDSNDTYDSNKGKHNNARDMAIHAEDSDKDDSSGPDSDTTDENSVDLVSCY